MQKRRARSASTRPVNDEMPLSACAADQAADAACPMVDLLSTTRRLPRRASNRLACLSAVALSAWGKARSSRTAKLASTEFSHLGATHRVRSTAAEPGAAVDPYPVAYNTNSAASTRGATFTHDSGQGFHLYVNPADTRVSSLQGTPACDLRTFEPPWRTPTTAVGCIATTH